MRAIIIYYSYSGHAEKVARYITEALKKKGEVDSQRLKPVTEITTFSGQCRAAFMRKRAELAGKVLFDMSGYDTIVIGCPVWAFAPPPAINAFLDNIRSVSGKKVMIFITSGSGAGVGKCFANISKPLENAGKCSIEKLNIPDARSADEGFVRSSIDAAIKRLGI
jgi:flavodoxin